MKNLHLLPTPQPSRLYFYKGDNKYPSQYYLRSLKSLPFNDSIANQNICITSDAEIKEGDWILFQGILTKALEGEKFSGKEKIILTDNTDLIKDGVQAIDDEFLEWFVKNPSCEFVNFISYVNEKSTKDYEIIIPKEIDMLELGQIIPKEEPKQETLEEAAKRWIRQFKLITKKESFIEGAKWQQQNSYSEEDIEEYAEYYTTHVLTTQIGNPYLSIKEWFEQFKKK
jgi:hypothetical protein